MTYFYVLTISNIVVIPHFKIILDRFNVARISTDEDA
jgi:hypothetical protein